MADVADVPGVQAPGRGRCRHVLRSLPSAYKLTKAEAKEAAKNGAFLVKVPSRQAQYLDTIAKAVEVHGGTCRKA